MEIHSPLHPLRVKRLKHYIAHLSGLVGYWPLWEGDGAVAVNHAPDNLRSLNGAITGATLGQAGKVGRAYSFDGINDDVSLGTLDPSTGDLTISLLYYTSSVNGTRCLLGKRDGWASVNDNRWIVARSEATNSIHFERWGGGVDFVVDLTEAAWTLLTITHDYNAANGCLLYTNGSLVATKNGFTYGTKTAAGLYVAQNGQDGEYMNMECQHLFFADRVLTAGEILKLAQKAGVA